MRIKRLTILTIVLTITPSFASAEPNSFPICTASGTQGEPAIDGDIVVWQDNRNGNYDIYGKDLYTGDEIVICTNSADQFAPKISGNIVVWQDLRNCPSGYSGVTNIYGYDLSTEQEFPILVNPNIDYEDVDIDGNILVYHKHPISGPYYLCSYDLKSGTELVIADWVTISAISGNIVVYLDGSSVYSYNLTTHNRFTICSGTAAHPVSISGDIVAWTDIRNCPGEQDIYGYNLKLEEEFPISTGTTPYNTRFNANVGGNFVVYEVYFVSNESGPRDIYGYNMFTRKEFAICTYNESQTNPAVSGSIVVWQDCRNDDLGDIYGAELPIICTKYPAMDFNYDCKVDFQDFVIFSGSWLECNLVPESDCCE
jgi:beta propeller repeat protein